MVVSYGTVVVVLVTFEGLLVATSAKWRMLRHTVIYLLAHSLRLFLLKDRICAEHRWPDHLEARAKFEILKHPLLDVELFAAAARSRVVTLEGNLVWATFDPFVLSLSFQGQQFLRRSVVNCMHRAFIVTNIARLFWNRSAFGVAGQILHAISPRFRRIWLLKHALRRLLELFLTEVADIEVVNLKLLRNINIQACFRLFVVPE